MKIAIPLNETREFSPHYGAASALACFEIDDASRALRVQSLLLPMGPPCSWPDCLHAEGVNVLLVGGMGSGARERYAALGIEVVVGVPADLPSSLAERYLAGALQAGESACSHNPHDHGHPHGHEHGHHGHSHEYGHDHPGHCRCAH